MGPVQAWTTGTHPWSKFLVCYCILIGIYPVIGHFSPGFIRLAHELGLNLDGDSVIKASVSGTLFTINIIIMYRFI